VLVGEVAFQVGAALPIGVAAGMGLAALSAASFSSDLYRLPVVVDRSTWLFAIGVTLATALGTSLLARRWLARLDLARALAPGE